MGIAKIKAARSLTTAALATVGAEVKQGPITSAIIVKDENAEPKPHEQAFPYEWPNVRFLPSNWYRDHKAEENCLIQAHFTYDAIYRNRKTGLLVLCSTEKHADGREWLHISLSKIASVPTYEDLNLCRRLFLGEDKYAVQIWPPRKEYVNVHENCLHLWALADGTDCTGMGVPK